ncbi:MAG: hypothetical protein CMM10_16355 [Rhodospirillaceae bacterium]|nr:hypothetical protein [Rhodospirillaceae bacterium]
MSIDRYDVAENTALSRVGYAQNAAFRTKTFEDYGFPTRMTELGQLVRYIDFFVGAGLNHLQPGNFFRGSSVESNYSEDEIGILTRLSEGVREITEKSCGKRYGVHFNHLSAIGLFRVVQAIASLSGKDRLSIFEVGPGCGYTGTLLGFQGHGYIAYDVTQGYYIWQSLLYEHFFSGEFTEVAGNEGTDLGALTRIAHLPWWSFMELYKDNPISADVVISNANLGEMHVSSLRYVLRVARQMLIDSDIGVLIFASVGACHLNSAETIMDEIGRAGYKSVMSNNVFVFTLEGKDLPAAVVDTLETQIPLFNPSGTEKTVDAGEFVKFRKGEYPEELDFYAFLSDWPGFDGRPEG